ncbi:hypothetical protein ABZ642_38620 [Streptomyces sp. NPDC007157]|uniref:DUF6891 domain-containing protein n=1 Tax=Streptomyces sp. NPDC007157 TaxID=3154681 RepID=UPI0033BFF9E1
MDIDEVVAVLTADGLSAVWDGNPDRAIELTSLTWHKCLVGQGGQRQDPAREASKQ